MIPYFLEKARKDLVSSNTFYLQKLQLDIPAEDFGALKAFVSGSTFFFSGLTILWLIYGVYLYFKLL